MDCRNSLVKDIRDLEGILKRFEGKHDAETDWARGLVEEALRRRHRRLNDAKGSSPNKKH